MVDTGSLTKRQKEIFEFVKSYARRARLSAHRARHREGDRAHLVVDGARPSGQPREGRGC